MTLSVKMGSQGSGLSIKEKDTGTIQHAVEQSNKKRHRELTSMLRRAGEMRDAMQSRARMAEYSSSRVSIGLGTLL